MIPRPGWYVKGIYYELTRMRQGISANVAVAPGLLVTSKIVVFDTITIDHIACYPSTASGAGVRVQTGFYAVDPLVGHGVGPPLGQTGPFAPTPIGGLLSVPLLAPISLAPGAYRRAIAVSAAAGSFQGSFTGGSEANDDQGNSLTTTNRGWSTPWTYSPSGLPTLVSGVTWSAVSSMPQLLALVT